MRPLHAAVLVVAAALAALSVFLLATEVPKFFDACRGWGMGNEGSSPPLGPGQPCDEWTGTSETRSGAAMRLLAVHGTLLVSSAAAAVGVLHARPPLLWMAAGAMGALSALLFLGASIAFLLTLAAGILYLVAGLRLHRGQGVAAAPSA